MMSVMLRRLHVDNLRPGTLALDEAQSHHARDVLRLQVDDAVELFDDAGHTAAGRIVRIAPVVEVEAGPVEARAADAVRLIVASAIPKGSRADWMVEKLSELGVARFVPLLTARGVVQAEGRNKRQRWQRLAGESAKQCRRAGVMRIDEPCQLLDLLRRHAGAGWFFSTAAGAVAAKDAAEALGPDCRELLLLVGPEGGWTSDEEEQMRRRGLTPVSLGTTILRVETAAMAAAVVAGMLFGVHASACPAGESAGGHAKA
ncbi:MAG: RsmE family RNA methyltransferase [Tepidisphaerales bacterium]